MPIRPLNDSEGMTLIELLVAMAIGAAVVLGIQAAVGAVVSVAERGRDTTDGALRKEAALMSVRRWLESAYIDDSAVGPGFAGTSRAEWGEAMDQLEFLTLDAVPLVGSSARPVWVRLRVAVADSGIVADYRETENDRISESEPSMTTVQVLPGVRVMDCRYLLELGDERRWFEGWSSRVRLPRAVECRFREEQEVGAVGDTQGSLLAMLPGLG